MSKSNAVEIAVKSSGAAMLAMAGAAHAQDFDGPYAGLSYTNGSGSFLDNFFAPVTYSLDGNAAGGFVGYNHVAGDWLFGAELAFSNGSYESYTDDAGTNPYLAIENIRDFKARAGRIFGKTLVYGVIGRSTANIDLFDDFFSDPDGSGTATALGLGFQTQLGNRMFIGGEYLTRDFSIDDPQTAFYAAEGAQLNTMSLRLGLQF